MDFIRKTGGKNYFISLNVSSQYPLCLNIFSIGDERFLCSHLLALRKYHAFTRAYLHTYGQTIFMYAYMHTIFSNGSRWCIAVYIKRFSEICLKKKKRAALDAKKHTGPKCFLFFKAALQKGNSFFYTILIM